MRKCDARILTLAVMTTGLLLPTLSFANNLNVSNVSLGARNPSNNTVVVQFDVSWENSWRNKINHDAVWLTVRLQDTAATPPYKKLCTMSAAGLSPAGFSVGTGTNLEFYVPADKAGAFLRRNANADIGNVSAQTLNVVVDYDSCGFSDNAQIYASVFGLEMVFVPQGSFYAGDYNESTAALNQGSSDSDPWTISSEDQISVSNSTTNGYRYVSNGNTGENSTGASFTLGSNFPKGYRAIYAMRYEINEGQWVEFVNSLPSAEARARHDLTDNSHKNADSVQNRNTVMCTGSPLSCTTQRPARAVAYLSWGNLAAFLDWAALRPMTELEFEKMSRGPLPAFQGEYAWGSAELTAVAALTGAAEDGSETAATTDANASFGNTTLTGGDTASGAGYQKGPVRNGLFATTDATRISSGGSYYGVMELSGNVKERVVTIGNAAGRAFTGVHGDGYLAEATGYEGNATANHWPGMDSNPELGITGAEGSGFRGGSWMDDATRLRTSDRAEAAMEAANADKTYGGRGVRTYDGS